MNPELSRLADALDLSAPAQRPLRLAFSLACAQRIRHLLEDPDAVACLSVLDAFVAGAASEVALQDAAQQVARIAQSHRGSSNIDGSAHAAVSATHAVAHAAAGRALDAASYAAYAMVYAYGGYAVNDPAAFAPEFDWQVEQLRALAQRCRA